MLFCKSNVLYLQVHGSLSGKCWKNNNSARATGSFNTAITFLSRLIDTPPLPPPIRSKLIDVYCICSWTNHKQRKSLKIWFFYIIIYINNMTLYSLISFADTSKYTFILNKEIPNCSCSHTENIDFVEEEIHTCTLLNYHQTINVHLTRPDIIIRII